MEATCKLGNKGCFSDGKCRYKRECENKVVTNADRIRAMNNYELAVFLSKVKALVYRADLPVIAYSTQDMAENLEWLQKPAEEE